jgi:hypothetical protein
MRQFCLWAILLLPFLVFSCTRPADKVIESTEKIEVEKTEVVQIQPGTPPLAILQAGEYPLWFQFTDNGPILIESIDDACFSAALIPWPLAPYIRFMLAQGDELLIAVNRDGFLRLAPWKQSKENATGLYRFSGGELWRQYTVSAFIMFDGKPAALLYRDDRFLDSKAPIPSPRLWTFDLFSIKPAASIPSLQTFAPEDGWDIDALRKGGDGRWYYRAVKKTTQPDIRMFRSNDLMQAGEQVSLGAFQNSALPEPLSAAPEPLRGMLAAILNHSGCGIAVVNSPDFQSTRNFAIDRENAPSSEGGTIFGFYSDLPNSFSDGTLLLAVQSDGTAYIGTENSAAIEQFSFPALPEGFVYTGVGLVENTIFASWEEQAGYSIGAAGFMVIRL